MRADLQPRVDILVASGDQDRIQAAGVGMAPRADYAVLAERLSASILEGKPPASRLHGIRPVRLGRSLGPNLRFARAVLAMDHGRRLIYSTGETWGLPVALLAAASPYPDLRHVIYAHRIYTPAWLAALRRLRSRLKIDCFLCATQYQALLLGEALERTDASVAVISQAVDVEFFDPDRASDIDREGYILSVGAEMRDYSLLSAAVSELDTPVRIQVSSSWMTGPRNPIGALPSNMHVQTDRLTYPELRDLYAGASLLAVPLIDTPQAAGVTTILEAMAMQVPVIATRSSGLPDCLVHEETGLIVDHSPHALREGIQRLLADPDLAARLARQARTVILDSLTLEHYADRATAIFQRLGEP